MLIFPRSWLTSEIGVDNLALADFVVQGLFQYSHRRNRAHPPKEKRLRGCSLSPKTGAKQGKFHLRSNIPFPGRDCWRPAIMVPCGDKYGECVSSLASSRVTTLSLRRGDTHMKGECELSLPTWLKKQVWDCCDATTAMGRRKHTNQSPGPL